MKRQPTDAHTNVQIPIRPMMDEASLMSSMPWVHPRAHNEASPAKSSPQAHVPKYILDHIRGGRDEFEDDCVEHEHLSVSQVKPKRPGEKMARERVQERKKLADLSIFQNPRELDVSYRLDAVHVPSQRDRPADVSSSKNLKRPSTAWEAVTTVTQMHMPETMVPHEFFIYDVAPAAGQASAEDEYDSTMRKWRRKVFPSTRPGSRAEVMYLAKVTDLLLTRLQSQLSLFDGDAYEYKFKETRDIESAVRMWTIVHTELVRQVFVHCLERGILLDMVQKGFTGVISGFLESFARVRAEGEALAGERKNYHSRIHALEFSNSNMAAELEHLKQERERLKGAVESLYYRVQDIQHALTEADLVDAVAPFLAIDRTILSIGGHKSLSEMLEDEFLVEFGAGEENDTTPSADQPLVSVADAVPKQKTPRQEKPHLRSSVASQTESSEMSSADAEVQVNLPQKKSLASLKKGSASKKTDGAAAASDLPDAAEVKDAATSPRVDSLDDILPGPSSPVAGNAKQIQTDELPVVVGPSPVVSVSTESATDVVTQSDIYSQTESPVKVPQIAEPELEEAAVQTAPIAGTDAATDIDIEAEDDAPSPTQKMQNLLSVAVQTDPLVLGAAPPSSLPSYRTEESNQEELVASPESNKDNFAASRSIAAKNTMIKRGTSFIADMLKQSTPAEDSADGTEQWSDTASDDDLSIIVTGEQGAIRPTDNIPQKKENQWSSRRNRAPADSPNGSMDQGQFLPEDQSSRAMSAIPGEAKSSKSMRKRAGTTAGDNGSDTSPSKSVHRPLGIDGAKEKRTQSVPAKQIRPDRAQQRISGDSSTAADIVTAAGKHKSTKRREVAPERVTAMLDNSIATSYVPRSKSLKWVRKMIAEIIEARAQSASNPDLLQKRDFMDFVYNFHLYKYGLRSMAEMYFVDFLYALRLFCASCKRCVLFVRMLALEEWVGDILPIEDSVFCFVVHTAQILATKVSTKVRSVDGFKLLPWQLCLEVLPRVLERYMQPGLVSRVSSVIDPVYGGSVAVDVDDVLVVLATFFEQSHKELVPVHSREQLHALFEQHDADADHYLTPSEFMRLIRANCENVESSSDLFKIYREALNRSSSTDLIDFNALWALFLSQVIVLKPLPLEVTSNSNPSREHLQEDVLIDSTPSADNLRFTWDTAQPFISSRLEMLAAKPAGDKPPTMVMIQMQSMFMELDRLMSVEEDDKMDRVKAWQLYKSLVTNLSKVYHLIEEEPSTRNWTALILEGTTKTRSDSQVRRKDNKKTAAHDTESTIEFVDFAGRTKLSKRGADDA